VVVTAQSRSQDVQKVPIAVQAVSADEIQNLAATDLGKMSMYVPGLAISDEQPTQPIFSIRGISTRDFGIGSDSAVGVYVDGVYAGRSGGTLLAFNDIKRIEVLKGPQGTLFGRNTAAGAISVITNEPSDILEGKVTLRAGNYGRQYGDALINVPLTDDVAIRVSGYDNQSDGWLKDDATGQRYGKDDDWGTRAAVRWSPTSESKVLLSWDHERLDQPPRPAIGLVALSDDTTERAPYPADPSTYLNPLHAPLYNDAEGAAETRTFDGVTLAASQAYTWGEFKSTTAWRSFDTFNLGDYDGTNHETTYLDTANIESNDSWYQEFKFSGTTSRVDWVGGLSYYHERADQTNRVDTNTDTIDTLLSNQLGADLPLTSISEVMAGYGVPYSLVGGSWVEAMDNQLDYDSWAGFGDVIWHLTDRLNLTTGLRYTHDHKDFSWYNNPREAPELDEGLQALAASGLLSAFPDDVLALLAAVQSNLIYTDAVGTKVKSSNTWSKLSPRVVLDYALTPDSMVYGSFSKGYKAGGYDSTQVGSLFQPEDVSNYEVGYKATLPDLHLLFSSSAYYYRYDNIQTLTLDSSSDTLVPLYVTRVSDQEAQGLDVDLQWLPIRALKLGANASYIDATYRHGSTDEGVDLSNQPTGAPKYSFAATLGYTWFDVVGGSLEFDVSHAYVGKTRCNDQSAEQGQCDVSPNVAVGAAQNRTDSRIDWNSASGKLGIGVYVNNVFDKQYVTNVDYISLSTLGTPYAQISEPRMWGVELRSSF